MRTLRLTEAQATELRRLMEALLAPGQWPDGWTELGAMYMPDIRGRRRFALFDVRLALHNADKEPIGKGSKP